MHGKHHKTRTACPARDPGGGVERAAEAAGDADQLK